MVQSIETRSVKCDVRLKDYLIVVRIADMKEIILTVNTFLVEI